MKNGMNGHASGKNGLEVARAGAANSCKVRLGARDWLLLSALETWGILGLAQLDGLAFRTDFEPSARTRLFFNELSRREYWCACRKRLSRLESGDFIRAHHFGHQPKAYTLSEKGHRSLKQAGRARFPGFRRSISEKIARHELLVNAVGLTLQEVLGLRVRTLRERFIWSRRGGWNPGPQRGISDVWVVDPVQPKGVEVELTQKHWKEYREIWRAYRRRLGADGVVLYLTSWPSGVARLLEYAAEFRFWYIHACDLWEFRDSCGKAPFRGALPGQKLVLGEAAAPAIRPIPAPSAAAGVAARPA